MRYLIYLALFSLFSLAERNHISIGYNALEYQKHPLNNFLFTYGKIDDKYSFLDGDLDIRGGITANIMLQKSGDFELFESVEKSRSLIHSLAIDYYPSYNTLISLGREKLELNLLNGSFDGVMTVGRLDDLSLKTFYFNHYALLYPSYYRDEKIEDGLYGLNLSYNIDFFDGEVSYFTYNQHNVMDIYTALLYHNFRLGAEYLQFTSSFLDNEKAYKVFTGYRYDRVYLEAGYHAVTEGSLSNIYALGGTEFKNFGLNSFLNQEEATNVYGDLVYNHHPFYTKLHLGSSSFKEGKGEEMGLTVGIRYGDIEASATYLTQKSDQSGEAGEPTQWVQSNLKYRF